MTVRRLGLTGVLCVLVLPIEPGGGADLGLQVLGNRITNFRPAEISGAELRVTVDYTFTGPAGEDVTIHATPEEAGGIFDPRTVEFDERAVEVGTHTATMTIVKRAGARDFSWLEEQEDAETGAPLEDRIALARAMAELPDDQRAAVVLCLSEGFSHAEAASILNLPLGTVKSHVTRGRERLLKALETQ